ncbi:MAG TPA: bifunctional homocysteine S-methyltransferase/methylenetetrahydrofolate reductase, partial [Anaerolineae bacterium]
MKFLEHLQLQPLLADGAMGTMLYERAMDFEDCLDAVNLYKPDLISDIHRQYAAAGADVIETNTFGANRFKLEHHSLGQRVAEVNARGVELARQASRDVRSGIYIGGSIGPLGVQLAPLGPVKTQDAFDVYREQILALADAGVDLLIFETFSDINELEQAIRAAKANCDLPIVAQMSFTRDNSTTLGATPESAAQRLISLGVDVIGANCSTGPRRMLDVVSTMHRVATEIRGDATLISAMPNAGFPEVRSERLMYPAQPEYFGDYATRFVAGGVKLVGGCCGTTPLHIKSMRAALDALSADTVSHVKVSLPVLPAIRVLPASAESKHIEVVASVLSATLQQNKLVITVEIEPPKSSDTQSIEETAQMLRDAGTTVLNIADSPMARMRMSGFAVAHRVQERAGVETVLHFPVRGRNLLRVQGDLLAAHALNIRNIFVVMGDPTRIGDYPQANDHHDIVPTGLTQLVKDRFNQGMDSSGSSIGSPCAFIVGMAANLTPTDFDKEAALLHKKIQCGADFAITQAIFDAPKAIEFLNYYESRYGKLTMPIISGILPLASV